MSTSLSTLYLAPKAFAAEVVHGQAWEKFDRAARAFVAAHHEAEIIARTDWSPFPRATRYRWHEGRVVEEAVRVTVTAEPWTD